jgi:hypothetical protein
MSAFELMNVVSAAQGKRPLVGDVARRAAERYESLGEGAREVVDRLLAAAPSPEHRAWILAALASGASLETLANFAERIDGVDASGLAAILDPTQVKLVQQSDTTCGSASLVVARMLNDPVYALKVLAGHDATTGQDVPVPELDDLPRKTLEADGVAETDAEYALRARFHEAELQAKARTNDTVGTDGERTLPWPDALGTSPWGAAEEMNGVAGGDGYGVKLVDSGSPDDRQQAYDTLERAGRDGRPAPVYVGDGTSPRHVVLVVGAGDGTLQVYEPGSGMTVTVTEDAFVRGDVNLGGWGKPWAVVAP